jgi:predicted membrane protein
MKTIRFFQAFLIMKFMHWLMLAVAMILVGLVLFTSRERFQPEFLDKRQVDKTVSRERSSYAQETNHMSPSSVNLGPLQGMETPFQVNQYKAYVL